VKSTFTSEKNVICLRMIHNLIVNLAVTSNIKDQQFGARIHWPLHTQIFFHKKLYTKEVSCLSGCNITYYEALGKQIKQIFCVSNLHL
jgi:hypothetical protein